LNISKVILLLIAAAIVFGFAAPALISAKSTISVLAGFMLIGLYLYWVINTISAVYKRRKEESDEKR